MHVKTRKDLTTRSLYHAVWMMWWGKTWCDVARHNMTWYVTWRDVVPYCPFCIWQFFNSFWITLYSPLWLSHAKKQWICVHCITTKNNRHSTPRFMSSLGFSWVIDVKHHTGKKMVALQHLLTHLSRSLQQLGACIVCMYYIIYIFYIPIFFCFHSLLTVLIF